MEVSDLVKKEYKSNSIHKNLKIYFPELDVTIENKAIYYETMRLSESIMESRSIEFVGCISSKFKIQVHGLKEDIKGKKISVQITTDNTSDEPICLFNGIVDSAIKQSNKQIKEITAYDELYTKGNIDVSAWYKGLSFPITLKKIRDSLFNYIGLKQVEKSLPNDGITINKQYDPSALQSLSVIKAICQINGAFGIINREGIFDYRILGNINSVPYPAITLFPSSSLFPADPATYSENTGNGIKATEISFYKSVEYEEYQVHPVDKVTVRQAEDAFGVTYGSGTNNYIIQGNMFTYGLSSDDLNTIAENVFNSVGGFGYYPFISNNNGLPFLECGLDAVSYVMIDYEKSTSSEIVYEQKSFYILNRELTGLQALRDSYSADGEEYQTEFITDLQTRIDTIKQNIGSAVEEYTYTREEIDSMFQEGLKVLSVTELPAKPDANTIYLIQGEVTVT